MDIDKSCPCGSGQNYEQCCRPYHVGDTLPSTAEALMRSRFSAYVLADSAYILKTWAGDKPEAELIDFSKENIVWERLEVLSTKKGSSKDNKGLVEFKAYYSKDGELHVLHELSRFAKTNGRWLYVDGVVKAVGNVIRQSNEGKNAPCPCGSGKKFKRCCGAS